MLAHDRIQKELGLQSNRAVTLVLDTLQEEEYLVKNDAGDYELAEMELDQPHNEATSLSIPVRGELSTGRWLPEEEVERNLGEITFDHLFPNATKVFTLRVSGLDLNGIDVRDGEYLFISEEQPAEEYVVVTIFRGETELNRIRKKETASGCCRLGGNMKLTPLIPTSGMCLSF